MTSINGLLANEIQDMSALKWVFCDSRVLVRKLASAFGHPTQVSTQVQLAPTCDYLPVRLTRALNGKNGNKYFSDKWSVADFCVCVHKRSRTKSLPSESLEGFFFVYARDREPNLCPVNLLKDLFLMFSRSKKTRAPTNE